MSCALTILFFLALLPKIEPGGGREIPISYNSSWTAVVIKTVLPTRRLTKSYLPRSAHHSHLSVEKLELHYCGRAHPIARLSCSPPSYLWFSVPVSSASHEVGHELVLTYQSEKTGPILGVYEQIDFYVLICCVCLGPFRLL